MVGANNPIIENFNINSYLAAKHVWVAKQVLPWCWCWDGHFRLKKLSWVDEALAKQGEDDIKAFTRNYHVAMQIALEGDLVATLPTRSAMIHRNDANFKVLPPPFEIPPMELKMIWSPLLHHDASHVWFRQLVIETVAEL